MSTNRGMWVLFGSLNSLRTATTLFGRSISSISSSESFDSSRANSFPYVS